MHLDTKRFRAIREEKRKSSLCIAIDDFSRKLYADTFPDKNQFSSIAFFHRLVDECLYTIKLIFSNNVG